MARTIIESLFDSAMCIGPYAVEVIGIGGMAEAINSKDIYAGLLCGGFYILGRFSETMPQFGINALRDKPKKVLETQVVEQ